jgi:integrase
LQKKIDGKYSSQQITFKTLLHTGARIMEIQNIKVNDVDLERGNIVLRVTKRIVNRPGIDKHGIRNIRIVTLSSEFTKFIKKVIRDYELKGEDKLPILTTQGANQIMKKKLKLIGLPDWQMLSLHNIRKTSENWLLALGIDWNKILKQFGHSSNISLKHYLSSDIFSFEEKREIHSILGDIREKMMGDVYGFK